MIRSRTSRVLTATLAAAALAAAALALQAPAQAAGPSNDSFASAAVISGTSATATGSNVGASTETDEPLTTSWGDSVDATLWFKWTAPVSAYYAINTVGSDFDTTLNVFTGASLTSLATVAMNDEDFGASDTSATGFAASAGTTYDIQVGGTGSTTTGNVQLAITTAAFAGTMTFGPTTSGSDPDPMEGCILFFADKTLDAPVASGCGTGNHNGSASFALGSVPAGTYYMIASDDEDFLPYPATAAGPSDLLPITVPGGNCTLTGMSVNFAAGTWTLPTGKDCSSAPACISARAALSPATAALASATATLSTDNSAKSARIRTVAKLKKQIRTAKKHGRSTAKLSKKLRKATAQAKAANVKVAAASAAVTAANRAKSAVQSSITASC